MHQGVAAAIYGCLRNSRLGTVRELVLTKNFLDLIFSPLFYDPGENKHFIWLNIQEENTTSSRPDGIMVSIPQKAESVTLGYYEIKTSVVQINKELAFVDLVRLATFSRNLMLSEANKKAISIQSVGFKIIVYFIKDIFPEVTTMTDILPFDVPRTIDDLADLIPNIDALKKLVMYINMNASFDTKVLNLWRIITWTWLT